MDGAVFEVIGETDAAGNSQQAMSYNFLLTTSQFRAATTTVSAW
ncbi:MAG: hypothetical protein R3B47_16735 [Bacteroidia bacterium]